jgi:hypothetical protein
MGPATDDLPECGGEAVGLFCGPVPFGDTAAGS